MTVLLKDTDGDLICESLQYIGYLNKEMILELQTIDDTWFEIKISPSMGENYIREIYNNGKIDLTNYTAKQVED